MSGHVMDERVVSMKFDNNQFEKAIHTSMGSLDKLSSTIENVKNKAESPFNGLATSLGIVKKQVEDVNAHMSAMTIFKNTSLTRLSNSLIDLSTKGLKSVANGIETVFNKINQGGARRASNIAQAKFMLEGLGVAWESVSADIDYAVQDTAYGLDSAAKACAQFSASGIKAGKQMKQALRGISGVAAMTNSEYDDIANVFTRVAGQGRLMAVDLNSLAARGINASATLGKALGKSEADIRAMVKGGEISFEMFSKVMDDAFGEHAKEANKTLDGTMRNINAAFSQIGEKFQTVFKANKSEDLYSFVNVMDAIRVGLKNIKAGIDPIVQPWEKWMQVLFKIANSNLTTIFGGMEDGAYKATKWMTTLFDALGGFMDKLGEAVYISGAWVFGINKKADDMWGGLGEAVKNGLEMKTQAIADALNSIDLSKIYFYVHPIVGLLGDIYHTVSDIIHTISSGLFGGAKIAQPIKAITDALGILHKVLWTTSEDMAYSTLPLLEDFAWTIGNVFGWLITDIAKIFGTIFDVAGDFLYLIPTIAEPIVNMFSDINEALGWLDIFSTEKQLGQFANILGLIGKTINFLVGPLSLVAAIAEEIIIALVRIVGGTAEQLLSVIAFIARGLGTLINKVEVFNRYLINPLLIRYIRDIGWYFADVQNSTQSGLKLIGMAFKDLFDAIREVVSTIIELTGLERIPIFHKILAWLRSFEISSETSCKAIYKFSMLISKAIHSVANFIRSLKPDELSPIAQKIVELNELLINFAHVAKDKALVVVDKLKSKVKELAGIAKINLKAGIFAVLEYFRTLTLDKFINDVTKLASTIKTKLVIALKAITNFVKNFSFNNLKSSASSALSSISSKLSGFTAKLNAMLKPVSEFLGNKFGIDTSGFGKVFGVIGGGAKTLGGSALTALSKFKKLISELIQNTPKLNKFKDTINNLFGPVIRKAIDKLSSTFESFKKTASKVLATIKDEFGDAFDYISGIVKKTINAAKDELAKIDIDSIKNGLSTIKDVIFDIGDAIGDFLNRLFGKNENVIDTVDGIEKSVNGIKTNKIDSGSDSLFKFAAAISSVSSATNDFGGSGFSAKGTSETLDAILEFVNKVASILSRSENFKAATKLAEVAIVAATIKVLSRRIAKTLKEETLVGTVKGYIHELKKITKSVESVIDASKWVIAFLGLSSGLLKLAKAVSILGGMDKNSMKRGLIALGGLTVGLVGIVEGMSFLNSKFPLAKFNTGIIIEVTAMAYTLANLGSILETIASFSWSDIGKSITAMAGCFGSIALVGLKPISIGNAIAVGAMALVLKQIIKICALVADYTMLDLAKIETFLFGLGGVVMALGFVISKLNFAPWKPNISLSLGKTNWKEVGVAILGLAALAGVLGLLSKCDPEGLRRAEEALGVIGGVIAVLIGISNITNKSFNHTVNLKGFGMLMGLAAVIGALAFEFAVIAFAIQHTDNEKLPYLLGSFAGSITALAGVLAAMGFLSSKARTAKIKSMLPALLGIGLAIDLIAGAFALIAWTVDKTTDIDRAMSVFTTALVGLEILVAEMGVVANLTKGFESLISAGAMDMVSVAVIGMAAAFRVITDSVNSCKDVEKVCDVFRTAIDALAIVYGAASAIGALIPEGAILGALAADLTSGAIWILAQAFKTFAKGFDIVADAFNESMEVFTKCLDKVTKMFKSLGTMNKKDITNAENAFTGMANGLASVAGSIKKINKAFDKDIEPTDTADFISELCDSFQDIITIFGSIDTVSDTSIENFKNFISNIGTALGEFGRNSTGLSETIGKSVKPLVDGLDALVGTDGVITKISGISKDTQDKFVLFMTTVAPGLKAFGDTKTNFGTIGPGFEKFASGVMTIAKSVEKFKDIDTTSISTSLNTIENIAAIGSQFGRANIWSGEGFGYKLGAGAGFVDFAEGLVKVTSVLIKLGKNQKTVEPVIGKDGYIYKLLNSLAEFNAFSVDQYISGMAFDEMASAMSTLSSAIMQMGEVNPDNALNVMQKIIDIYDNFSAISDSESSLRSFGKGIASSAKAGSFEEFINALLPVFDKLKTLTELDLSEEKVEQIGNMLSTSFGALTSFAEKVKDNKLSGTLNKIAPVIDTLTSMIAKFNNFTMTDDASIDRIKRVFNTFILFGNNVDENGTQSKLSGMVEPLSALANSLLQVAHAASVLQTIEDLPTLGQNLNSFLSSVTAVDPSIFEASRIAEITAGLNDLITAISDFSSKLKTAMTNLANVATKALKTDAIKDGYRQVGKVWVTAIRQGVERNYNVLYPGLHTAFHNAKAKCNEYAATFSSVGKYLVEGIAVGVGNNTGLLTAACARAVKAGIQAANDAGKIKSPSRVMMWTGEMLMQGAAKGVDDNSRLLEKSMSDAMRGAIDATEMFGSTADLSPVIKPQVDLTKVAAGVGQMNTMFQSTATIAAGMNGFNPYAQQAAKYTNTDSHDTTNNSVSISVDGGSSAEQIANDVYRLLYKKIRSERF